MRVYTVLCSVRSLLASLGAVLVLLASPSVTHAATISDTVKITDDAGNILNDSQGMPMTATLSEGSGGGVDTPNSINFTIPIASSPDVPQVVLTEPDTPPGSAAVVSDSMNLAPSGSVTFFFFSSDADPAAGECPAEFFPCIPETGSDQDVTDAFFFVHAAPFRIIVSSDVSEVPEPTTITLIGVGLSGLGLAGRKRLIS